MTHQTAAADTAAVIYQRLDAITGGIAQWLANEREEVWYAELYHPFHIASLGPEGIAFGFRFEQNGDSVPNPIFSLTITDGRVNLDSMMTETFIGYHRGDLFGSANACANLLDEIQRRQRAGAFTGRKVYR